MRNFEAFTGRSAPVATQPTMTIQQKGTFGLNRAAVEALGKAERVELLFDRGARVIGLRPVDESVPHGYPVRRQNASHSYVVAATAFCQTYGIPTDRARRYTASTEDGILVVDLNTEATEVRSNRERGRRAPVAAVA